MSLGALPLPLEQLGEELVAAAEPAVDSRAPAMGGLTVLEAGVVRVLEAGRVLGLLEAPQLLDVLSALGGGPSPLTYQPLEGAVLRRISPDALAQLRAQHPGLEGRWLQRLARAWQAEEAAARADEARRGRAYFAEPNARILPGPFEALDFTMVAFVMEADAAALAGLFPPGVRALPGTRGRYLLTFNDFPSMVATHRHGRGETVAYREVALFVPCLGPGLRPGLFLPALFPDSPLAVAMGREQYGFPKRVGRVTLGQTTCTLSTGGELQAGVSWRAASACPPADAVSAVVQALLGPSTLSLGAGGLAGLTAGLLGERGAQGTVPLRMRKQILAPGALIEPRYDVDALVEVPFQVSGAKGTQVLQGAEAEEFGPDLAWARGGRCLAGAKLVTSFRFGEGRVLTNYLPGSGSSALGAVRQWMGARSKQP